jgi:hypothetical protein
MSGIIHANDTHVFARVPNAVEDTSVPPRLPVNPSVVNHACRPPVVGVPEVGAPYVEPVDVVPPPMFRMQMIAPVAMGVSVAGAAVDDPLVGVGLADGGNNGVFPCITYGGQNPIYAPFGVIAGLSGDIANLSNEITSISNEIVIINSNITTLSSELNNLSGYVYANPVSNWSTFPAVSAVDMNNNSITNISSLQIDAQILTADASDLFLNGIAVATVTDISNVADWSLFPAISDVQMDTHNIVSEISGQGLFEIASWNTLELIGGLSGGTTTISGFLPVPLKGDVFIQSGKNKDGEITLKSGLLGNSNVNIQGYINQTSVGGGTAISNYFDSAVQVGAGSGFLGVDGINQTAGSSALFVSGGTTLDGGGIIHGITIGTVPVAGINTQRIDVLPVGILLTTPTFITMNGLGAANIAMGGAVAIAAGSYVTLEHGFGAGQNGVFVQNTNRDVNARLVFTGGGTLFNATTVQSSNIVNPNGVRFYNGVYNPSGGSVIVPPIYGRAIVDLSTSSSYFATLTGGDLPATKNTDSVFIGTLTNLSTGGASGTIVIGKNANMQGQQSNAVAIGTDAGKLIQGTGSVAIGYTSGYLSQGADSVAIGYSAGEQNLGSNSIAIGKFANVVCSNHAGTIVLNATGVQLDAQQANSTYISPMRNIDGSGFQVLARNAGTGEIIQTLIDASSGFVESDWALYPAVTNVNVSGFAISNVSGLQLDGNQVSTLGNTILINGINPVSNWSAYQANHNLDMAGFNITNVSEGTFQKLTLNSTEIALGLSAGITSQGLYGIAIGAGAGSNTQGNSAFALGNQAGNTNQGASCVAIGNFAGATDQQTFAIAIGTNAGDTTQGTLAVAIGNSAGQVTQGENSVAIGADTAISSQGSNSVAIGYSVAGTSQGTGAVAIGSGTAGVSQGVKAVAIGFDAAYSNQASNAVAIGNTAGFQGQLADAIAIGAFAANSNQSLRAVAIGAGAGASSQGADSVAIGTACANVSQGANAIAMGNSAGQSNQGVNAVAIGQNAGSNLQGTQSVAVGNFAGYASQGNNATAVGYVAGFASQGARSTAVGSEAGAFNLGSNSVAIGYAAAYTGGSFSNVVVVNATGGVLNPAQANSCYIAPIAQTTDAAGYQTSMLRWNSTTKEVSYAPQVGSLQVIATSATAINLLPTAYGKTFVLTGTTTQNFTTTSLTANDVGWFCVVHNGNATNGGDINLTGMTGTAIIHEQKNAQNGGIVYLYWNGTGLVGY